MSEQIKTLKCIAIDDNGKGVVRDNNSTMFIDDLLVGEEGQIKTVFKYGKLKDAKLIKRINDSSLRVKPKCKYYKECGGCNLMHLSYEGQLEYKRKKVQNLLHKFGHIDFEVSKCLGMSEPFHFRNKIQVPVRLNKEKKVVSGFYKENTHELIAQDVCLIEDKKARKVLDVIKSLMDKYHILPYDEDKRIGLIRHIIIKTSLYYDEIMVVLVTAQDEFKGKSNLAREIIKAYPSITTVVQNINTRKTNVILGEKERVLYGSGKIKDSIFGLDFLISAKSFYQTNPYQVEVLYKTALDLANLQGTEDVLDAYSGTGTIGLCASRYCKSVKLVELVSDAVKDGILNAKINKIDNVTFINEDCTKYILDNYKEEHFDVIFMDPPRKGSTSEFLEACKKIAPEKIVYVSCNPVTLARDLVFLLDEYDLKKVVPVDMFPHTAHVETVVLLEKKENKRVRRNLFD